MNYRHAFHAGNFADVFKHVILTALLDALTAKDKPLCCVDTHAGRGRYSLDAVEAEKTGEWRDGIARLFDAPNLPAPLQRYVDAVRACNADGTLQAYPGSPWLAANALRSQDSLVLCELDDEQATALRALFRDDRRVHVHARDGYAALNALLPPKEKRGLVLIDPPYEVQSDDFTAVEAALAKAHARWPNGVFAVWYPIKSHRTIAPFHRHLARGPFERALVAELMVQPDDSPLRLNGCGMLIANPPWRLDATLIGMLPALLHLLAQSPRASQRLRWLCGK
ncbi:MAG TPA: 23S rRNA (adenine(2030)-N(6))-methyltransferase RlmJ [Rhodanobacteraceae bacterium]|jgi:23S rRNA (adenine2030-N6)-methyltransferase|nr:23S rRNA (adenine(2030)-N(6))-methyltransferase RlmJ [Rhodanobacteraceae bacterium]